MSKPRIFVSSTYYDLKYVRERIERFISAYCFDPILFESDEVYFNPNTSLDTSCYNEVNNCHMMILIIGGRYGSLASIQTSNPATITSDQNKKRYEDQYVSITRKEYETAKQKGIPVMIFIEQNVLTEYRTYQTNQNSLPEDFKFAYVDDVRIFKFIAELEQNAIKAFSKVDDIEHYFSLQISGMLLAYLTQLQEEKESAGMKNAVDEIKVVSQSMQKMINLIAEKVRGDDQEYKDLLNQQNRSLIDFFIELMDQNMNIEIQTSGIDDITEYTQKICDILYETIFNKKQIDKIGEPNTVGQIKEIRQLQKKCTEEIALLHEGLSIEVELLRIKDQVIQILDLIQQDESLKTYFHKKLYCMIDLNLSWAAI